MARIITFCFAVAVAITQTVPSNAQLYFPPASGGEWATVNPSELGWCLENVDSLYQFLDRNGTKAFIVLLNGRIAIEWYAEGFEQTDTWYWASAAKTVTATLVGIAQAEASLLITEHTSAYLGDGWSSLTPQQESKITVRHQLTMTSGLDDGVEDPYCTLPSCLIYKSDAGTRWAYHNGPYTLLDKVIQEATGSTLNAYFASKLRDPIGMDGLFVKQGYNNLLLTTPRAMARFGLLAMNNFIWDGTPILDSPPYVTAMMNTSQDLNPSYGYLWWLNGKETFMIPGVQAQLPGPLLPNEPMDGVNALGKNNQILSVVPSAGLVVIRMGDAAGEDGSLVPTVFPNNMWGALKKVICTLTDVEESEPQPEWGMITPQPVQDVMTISVTDPIAVDIYDINGVRVLSSEPTYTVNCAAFAPGLYVIRNTTTGSVRHFVKAAL